ncbi:MAG: hypothetical protein KGH87_08200 [Thaumarchaeota archaeon]|nr:hypothetical protein [Nitrososphaerota archaeon]MDE1839885.1 hypothetical protein [Nitrososphaerota archaeon]
MSFVKPFEYMYEDTDKVIEQGTKIPAVNQFGNTPTELKEQIPVITPIVELPHVIPPQPPVIEKSVIQPIITQQDKPEAVTSVPTIEQPPVPVSTAIEQPITKPKNIVINVEDNAKSTDR